MSDAFHQAERLLRHVARETNLLIATRPVCAEPAGHPVADALLTIASRLGSLPADVSSPRALAFDVSTGAVTLGGVPLPVRASADERLAFAMAHMPVSRALAAELAASGAVRGLRIGVSMTLEPKTANLALLLRDAGADVAVYAHPDETDAEVAQALRRRGVPVDADASLTGEGEKEAALRFLARGFDIVADDGSHLVRLAHESAPHLIGEWIGVTEETTSGLTPLRLMERLGVLATPVIAVNDAATKKLFDNRYGTAQSCVFAIADILDSAGITVRDQPALVIGYGPVGHGVASYLRALGAEVSVAERDAVRALQAAHEGFKVGTATDLAPGALVVSATGAASTITPSVRDSAAAVAVAGGVPGEMVLEDVLDRLVPVATHVERLDTSGTLVLDRGGCINVTAAEGNPIEIMDLSFATQIAAIGHLAGTRPTGGVLAMPADLVTHVADVAAAAFELELEPAASAPLDVATSWHSRRYLRERNA